MQVSECYDNSFFDVVFLSALYRKTQRNYTYVGLLYGSGQFNFVVKGTLSILLFQFLYPYMFFHF